MNRRKLQADIDTRPVTDDILTLLLDCQSKEQTVHDINRILQTLTVVCRFKYQSSTPSLHKFFMNEARVELTPQQFNSLLRAAKQNFRDTKNAHDLVKLVDME